MHSASFLLKNLNPKNSQTIESEIQEYLQTPYQLSLLIKPFTYEEVTHQTNDKYKNKPFNYDLITDKIIKELPKKNL